jgi:hypothetical protein
MVNLTAMATGSKEYYCAKLDVANIMSRSSLQLVVAGWRRCAILRFQTLTNMFLATTSIGTVIFTPLQVAQS